LGWAMVLQAAGGSNHIANALLELERLLSWLMLKKLITPISINA
jgi:hypothetical protein